jgi:fructose-1,6-bisphosphatase/inositol monophosphatase family enzyme
MPIPKAAALEDWLIDLSDRVAKTTRRALKRVDAGRVVRVGAYGSDTVMADAIAEQVVIDAIADAPIPLNLFSEEIGHVPTKGATWTLIADPIDGTRNAIRHIPFHCVALAIGQRDLNGVELGVVRDVNTDDVYAARKKHGARLNGRPTRVRDFDKGNIVVAAALDYERELSIKWRPHVHFRDMGSSALELVLVGTGGIDLFLATKKYLRIVDIAASVLFLREAGGYVFDLRRKPLNAGYDLKERIAFYAMGDRKAWSVLD